MVMMAMVHAVVCRTVTVGSDAGHVMVMSDLSGTAVTLTQGANTVWGSSGTGLCIRTDGTDAA